MEDTQDSPPFFKALMDITDFFAYHGKTDHLNLCLSTFDAAGYRVEQGTPLYERCAWANLMDPRVWVSEIDGRQTLDEFIKRLDTWFENVDDSAARDAWEELRPDLVTQTCIMWLRHRLGVEHASQHEIDERRVREFDHGEWQIVVERKFDEFGYGRDAPAGDESAELFKFQLDQIQNSLVNTARDRTKIALRYLLDQHPWDAFAKKMLNVLLEAQGRVTGDPPQLATQYNTVHRAGGGHVHLPQPQPLVQQPKGSSSSGASAAMSKQWQQPPAPHGSEPDALKGSQGGAPSVGMRGLAGGLGKRRAAEQSTPGGDGEGGFDDSGGGSYDSGNQDQSGGGGASEAGGVGGDTARVTNELKQRSQRLEAHGVDPLQEILAAAAPRRNATSTQRGGRRRSASHNNAPTKSMCDPRDPAKTHREVFDSQPEDPTGNTARGSPVASTSGRVESESKMSRQGGPVALPEHSPAPIVQNGFKEKGVTRGAKRQKKTKWSDAEVQALETGVGTYGEGSWAEIHKNVPIFRMNSRTQVDMKDKWRNIKKKRDQDA